jgi:hypothetical protein
MGHFSHGKWFCSPACSEKDPEVKRVREMIEKKGDKIVEDIDDEELEGIGVDVYL